MQGSFQTTGSQISLISSEPGLSKNIHFFTSYNPNISIYKPFIFPAMELCDKEGISNLISMNGKSKPLWSIYHKMNRRDRKALRETLMTKEKEFVTNMLMSEFQESAQDNLFEKCIDQEIQIIQS